MSSLRFSRSSLSQSSSVAVTDGGAADCFGAGVGAGVGADCFGAGVGVGASGLWAHGLQGGGEALDLLAGGVRSESWVTRAIVVASLLFSVTAFKTQAVQGHMKS